MTTHSHVTPDPIDTRLESLANRLRIDSIEATTTAKSGHPTSCCSAAEIMSVLFFDVMRYDPVDPARRGGDRFVLSKGHAAPILYAVWAEAGLFPREELKRLRTADSDLEGHPTPRLPFVDVATGSLGQGLSAGAGMAFDAMHLDRTGARIYVLLGDGECSEGSVWEAADFAAYHELDNLCAVVDVNRLGQSGPTELGYDLEAHARRWSAFGWSVSVGDGHDVTFLRGAFERAEQTRGTPSVILARTVKGKGIAGIEGKEGHHGKALSEFEARQAVGLLRTMVRTNGAAPEHRSVESGYEEDGSMAAMADVEPAVPNYERGSEVATREAFGVALVALGEVEPRVVVLDGDVKDSTRTHAFAEAFPERFVECFIAEQNMVGVGMGLAASGKLPFIATFACFLTRAHDSLRMAAISGANLKIVGSHAGVSIGQDGPSQMGLEDIAMMAAQPNVVVLYPCDAVSCHRLVGAAARHPGMVYLRTTRGKTPVLYDSGEEFLLGGSKILRQSPHDQATLVAAGITVFEALKAQATLEERGISVRVIDLYSIEPIDEPTLVQCARETDGKVFTVEDHYAHGGLGDAVASALGGERVRVHKLAVTEIPHSGPPATLLERYGIGHEAIVRAVMAHLDPVVPR